MGYESSGEQSFSTKDVSSPNVADNEVHADYSMLDTDDMKKERRNSSTSRISTILESLRLFFEPTKRNRSASNTSTQMSCEPSSGYHSLDASCEVDDSYIKVAKFSDTEEKAEVGHYGTFKEYQEMEQQQNLASKIKELIESNPTNTIQISDYLTLRTAGDVLNLSKCEPYGLKGCKLIVIIEDGENTIELGNVFPEKGIVCTFEITLVLHIKRNPCRRLPFFNCKQTVMIILEQYELRKEKMYTSKKKRMSPTFPS